MRALVITLALFSADIYANTEWSAAEVDACLSQKALDLGEVLEDDRFGEEDLAKFAESLRVSQNPDCVVYINGRFGPRCEPGSLTTSYPEIACTEEGVKGLLDSGFPFIYLEKDSSGGWIEGGGSSMGTTPSNDNWN
jgi:hypothetical protein